MPLPPITLTFSEVDSGKQGLKIIVGFGDFKLHYLHGVTINIDSASAKRRPSVNQETKVLAEVIRSLFGVQQLASLIRVKTYQLVITLDPVGVKPSTGSIQAVIVAAIERAGRTTNVTNLA